MVLIYSQVLEIKLDKRFPAGRIIDSLKNYNCTHLDSNRWQFTYYDEIIDACANAFDVKLNMKYRTQQELRRLLKY